MASVDIKIDKAQLRTLFANCVGARKQINDRAGQAIRKAAFDMEAQAKLRAPVRYGVLRASIWTESNKYKGQNKAITEARQLAMRGKLNSSVGFDYQNVQTDNLTAFVGVAVNYAPYVEFGTRTKKAHPFFWVSYNVIKGQLVNYFKNIV